MKTAREMFVSLTTMLINHIWASIIEICVEKWRTQSLKKFEIQMSRHEKRYRSEEMAPASDPTNLDRLFRRTVQYRHCFLQMIRIKRRGKPPAERMVWYNIFTFKWSTSSGWKSLLQCVWSDATIFYLQINQTILMGPCKGDGPVVWIFLQMILIIRMGKSPWFPLVSWMGKEVSPVLRFIIQFSSFRAIYRTDGMEWDHYHRSKAF